MSLEIHIPRYHSQYGFWEFYTEPAEIVGKTHRGNLIVRFGFATRLIFDKITGICVSRCCRKHVPDRFRRMKVTGFSC